VKGGLYTPRQEAPISNMTSNGYPRNGADPRQTRTAVTDSPDNDRPTYKHYEL